MSALERSFATFIGQRAVRRFAVFGRPIAHSLSPQIHQYFAEQRRIRIDYQRIECADADFAQTVQAFAQAGGAGLNITTPFKRMAFELCPAHSAVAATAGAVNTIRAWSPDEFEGHNTDGLGLCRDLRENLHLELSGANILLLGAGATAFIVAQALSTQDPARLVIFNRSPDRLNSFLDHFSQDKALAGINSPVGFDPSAENQFDLIINCASSALQADEAVLPDLTRQTPDCLAYDLTYGQGLTAFTRWASDKLHSRVCDGLGMLVEQAAFSFVWWNGEPLPQTQTLIHSLAAEHSIWPRDK